MPWPHLYIVSTQGVVQMYYSYTKVTKLTEKMNKHWEIKIYSYQFITMTQTGIGKLQPICQLYIRGWDSSRVTSSVATWLFEFSPDFVGKKTQVLKTTFRAPKLRASSLQSLHVALITNILTQLNSTENYGRRCLTPLSPHRNYIQYKIEKNIQTNGSTSLTGRHCQSRSGSASGTLCSRWHAKALLHPKQ